MGLVEVYSGFTKIHDGLTEEVLRHEMKGALIVAFRTDGIESIYVPSEADENYGRIVRSIGTTPIPFKAIAQSDEIIILRPDNHNNPY